MAGSRALNTSFKFICRFSHSGTDHEGVYTNRLLKVPPAATVPGIDADRDNGVGVYDLGVTVEVPERV